jgi:drug/metabolite transporter (DMT)-like permease
VGAEVLWALPMAVVGAAGYGTGSALQARAARRAHGAAVLHHPAYLLGLACDGLAWLASLVAMRGLPLFVVQAVLTASLAVTILLAPVVAGTRLRRRELGGVGVVVGALVIVCAGSGPSPSLPAPSWFLPAALAALALLTLVGAATYPRGGWVPLALLAGASFSGVALCVRVLPTGGQWPRLAGQPLAWTVLGFAVLGTVLYARSLERGPVGPATVVLWLTELIVAGVGGALLLGDRTRPGWLLPTLAALIVAAAASAVLAEVGVGGNRGRSAHDDAVRTTR